MNMLDTCRDYIKRVGETMTSYHGVLGSKRSRLGPQEIRRLNDVYLTFCVIALSLDPLFFYILVFNVQKKCLRLDTTLGTPVVVLRFLVDFFYIIHMVFQFRAAIVSLSSQASGRVELFKEMRAIAWRYLFFYFLADVFMILPLPQVLFFAIVPKLNVSKVLGATKSLNFIVVFQYVLRFLRICSLLKKVTSNSGILAGTAWVNLFLYMLASHVVGAFWYLFSIERNVTCWSEACKNHAGVIRSDMFAWVQSKETDGKKTQESAWKFFFLSLPRDLRSDTKRYICMGAILKISRLVTSVAKNFSHGLLIPAHHCLIFPTPRTARACCEVEAFTLKAEDLKFVASQFRRSAGKRAQHTFRFYSSQWTAWGACYIQEAWRRYCKKKLEKSLRKEENRLQDSLAEAGGSSPALGSAISALRSAANALSHVLNSDHRRPMLVEEKPADLNDSE